MKAQNSKFKAQGLMQSLKFLSFCALSLVLHFEFCALRLQQVYAQTFSLSIIPPLLEVMIKPGKSITHVYKLQNLGDDTQVWVDIVPFTPTEDGKTQLNLNPATRNLRFGRPELTVEGQPTTYLKWFSFQNADRQLPGSFRLEPGKTQELVLKIKVPEDVQEDDYYTALTFQVKPGKNLAGPNLTKVSGIVTSNILLTVSKTGLPPKVGKISDFKVKQNFCFFKSCFPLFDSFDQISFSLKIENQGQALFKPEGKIKIYNIFGKEVDSLKILPQNILVHSQRQILCQQDEEQKECQFQSKFLAGRYKALADLKISETDKTVEAETYFYVFPWKLALAFVAGLLILAIILKKF